MQCKIVPESGIVFRKGSRKHSAEIQLSTKMICLPVQKKYHIYHVFFHEKIVIEFIFKVKLINQYPNTGKLYLFRKHFTFQIPLNPKKPTLPHKKYTEV